MFKNILLPTDGSQGVARALDCAVAIALKFGAKIHVLHVIEVVWLVFNYPEYSGLIDERIGDKLREGGVQIVEDTVESIRAAGIEAVEGSVREGSPAEVILQYARENAIDLIVMGTHGRRGLNRLLLGSVAEEVVRRSEVPVLTVRMKGFDKPRPTQ